MDAATLRQVFDAVYLLMLGAWAGAAGLVLLVLPSRPGVGAGEGAEHRRLLSRFYALGATCGAVALPAAVCARLAFPEYRTPWFAPQALALIGLTLPMFAGNARREGNAVGPPAGAIRARLALLIAGLAVLAATQALRPAPRTRGILERPPGAAASPGSPGLPSSAGGTRPGSLH
jgi:hypothetical protein